MERLAFWQAANPCPTRRHRLLSGAAGAYIGHEVSGGEPEGAVLGAVAGALAGTAFDYWKDSGGRKAYSTGYVTGQSDEVKRLCWIMKRLCIRGKIVAAS